MTMFADRRDAGRSLAAGLAHLGGQDLVVLREDDIMAVFSK